MKAVHSPQERCARLRVMASSDIHGHIRSYDYMRDCRVSVSGFSRLASLIDTARQETPCQILLDNGDFLQGTVLADLHSTPESTKPGHPMLSCFEQMGYDAIGLGNHEFNYGLDMLRHVARLSRIPLICANALTRKGDHTAEDETLLPPYVMLSRNLADPATGRTHPLKIGVLSVLPPQITKWDGSHLKGHLTARDMVEAATLHSQDLRKGGADVVIALAHSGIEAQQNIYEAENAALDLAALPDIDAVIAGHTHRVFPGPGHNTTPEIDPDRGTLHGTPAVMPGFNASHLGLLDLDLRRDGDRWRVVAGHSHVRPVFDPGTRTAVPEHPDIVATSQIAHDRTLHHIKAPLGQTNRPIRSYFSLVQSDLPVRLVAEAQRQAVRQALQNGPHANLPLLSATAPYQTGGRAGPLAYCDIPAGTLRLRHASDLCPFPNTLCAVRVTGRQLYDWLEQAASCFHQIHPGRGPQPLLNPEFPGHAVDTLDGLNYRIDLTAPARFDHKGHRRSSGGTWRRVRDVTYQNRPVAASDQFVVALNNYRAFGGGPYAPFNSTQIVLASDLLVRDVLVGFLKSGGANSVSDDPVWSFQTVPGAAGLFQTGPGAIQDAAGRFMTHGQSEDGFISMCLPLDRGTCESAA